MTYKSPIEIINEKANEYLENGVMKSVYKAEFIVDKDELYKALRYDRGQYEKGYADRDHEIVRCKDCKFWYMDLDEKCMASKSTPCTDENDFCSWAERREE